MSNMENWPDHPNAWDARVIAGCIAELVTNRPADDRYKVLEAISFHVNQCFGDVGVPNADFVSGIDDPSVFRPLLDNPAAGPLLAYVVNALINFDFGHEGVPQSTADRRAALAKAFCLTGKQGKQDLPLIVRMNAALYYANRVRAVLERAVWQNDEEKEKAYKDAQATGVRATFRMLYKEDYETANDTHKSQMNRLMKIIEETSVIGLAEGE